MHNTIFLFLTLLFTRLFLDRLVDCTATAQHIIVVHTNGFMNDEQNASVLFMRRWRRRKTCHLFYAFIYVSSHLSPQRRQHHRHHQQQLLLASFWKMMVEAWNVGIFVGNKNIMPSDPFYCCHYSRRIVRCHCFGTNDVNFYTFHRYDDDDNDDNVHACASLTAAALHADTISIGSHQPMEEENVFFFCG